MEAGTTSTEGWSWKGPGREGLAVTCGGTWMAQESYLGEGIGRKESGVCCAPILDEDTEAQSG